MPLPLLLAALCLAAHPAPARACQLPSEWRPLSEGCRAELAETIVYAKVLALHPEVPGLYNYLPWQYQAGEEGLFYSAEVEMLCDQAWGSMLEVPAGSRLNLTGLGYFSCHSHTVVQDYSYFFFVRMDENYNLLPHGVNFQDAIFPDTQENRRMFSSLFQFANCSQGQQLMTFSSDWEIQEDNRHINYMTCSDEAHNKYGLADKMGQRMEATHIALRLVKTTCSCPGVAVYQSVKRVCCRIKAHAPTTFSRRSRGLERSADRQWIGS
ncbi:coiled-coil domain-containing protein 3 isoform X2 [Meriones unguiculatus]|uniref:coiled-coil domain-containing protein 3 isoform X2 n=1 Tax=Meriones unguiculatus TaxID=10047 RepID=UPI00293E6F4A|nr:coiled-coil domain-containing protein 3 isoform X2 [Meriones unguiculatus]